MKVCMILTDGFEEMEAVGTYALLRRAGLTVDVYSLRGTKATGRFGLTCSEVQDFARFKDDGYAAVVLPGGPQYKELEANRGVQQALADFHRAGKYLCAICASPTILGRAGYLKGKNYTCFTCMNEDFGGRFTNAYATTDGKLITGKSAAATPEFALAIITALLGPQAAEKTKKEIYYQEYK